MPRRFAPRDPARLAYITQTTLSVDDTAAIVAILKERFPAIVGPRKEDICYATTNRQAAVKAIAPRCDALIVVGAPNSSNSLRLVEVAERAGCPQGAAGAAGGRHPLGRSSRASPRSASPPAPRRPELLVTEIIDAFRARFDVTVESVVTHRGADRLQRAARAARGRRSLAPTSQDQRMAVYTEVPDDELAALHRQLRAGRAALLQGHRRGRGEHQLSRAHREGAVSSSRSTRSAWRRADLPFFLGLMEHLAKAGLNCPTPVHDRAGPHAAHAGRPAGRARHLPGGRVDPAAAAAPLPARWARRWPGCTWPGSGFALTRANALGLAGWRPLYRALPGARRRDRAGARRHHRAGARRPGGQLAGRPAAGHHPRRPVSRQRVLPRRPAVRA